MVSRTVSRLAGVVIAVLCVTVGVVGLGVTAGVVSAGVPASVTAAGVTVGQASVPVLRHRAVVRDPKKGVAAWSFHGVNKALAKSGASWYYTWSWNHHGIVSPHGVHFVPMIWGEGNVTAATLRRVTHDGRYLLGFNEPDMASQSDLSVATALSLWPQLMATGMRLGSPAVASGAATPGGWLDQFMRGVTADRYRVNFITVHWYGADFATGPAVDQLADYLHAIHSRYHLPIWLTEFALIRFGTVDSFPSPKLQAAFIKAATAMLQHLSYVKRYAWFALPATPGDGSAGLFRPGPVVTRAGRAFEAAGTKHHHT
jgi:hypothetical protein